jgi:hypothetical protein
VGNHHHPGHSHPDALRARRNRRHGAVGSEWLRHGSGCALALMEHALSADFATRIAALAAPSGALALRAKCHRAATLAAAVLRETLRKKAFSQQLHGKKRLRKCAHVLFSAPILLARPQGATFATQISF